MTTALRDFGLLTTMIGSLPHHNIDAALAFSFQVDIPFLPQIPIRNPWEYMIAQALEGMPGLNVEKDGSVVLDVEVWNGRAHSLDQRLLQSFSTMAANPNAFEAFEPSAATSSSWQPFLWELEEREIRLAKIQIAGPITSQWALQLSDGSNTSKHTDIATQIYRLVLARALGMTRRLQRGGIQPILYLDEPGLYGLLSSEPRHLMALQELRILIRALRKEGVIVGLHCCSNTDWKSVYSLELDILSVDSNLSLSSLLEDGESFEKFLKSGGRLSLGVVPTSKNNEFDLPVYNANALYKKLFDIFGSRLGKRPELARQALATAIYTPACGLALQTTADAENVLATLLDFGALCKRSLG